ncbi:MAG: hypothetical protein ACRDWS_04480 [Acidimicrobiia bacterium]
MTTSGTSETTMAPTVARHAGYIVAIVVNALMIIFANNILDWARLPFLTEDFDGLLWLIDISLGAGIVVNLVYTFHDPAWFKALTQIGLNLIALFLTIRTSQVFPFDFSEYRFDWEPLTRFILVMVGIGTLIGIVVEIVKLVRSLVQPLPTDSTSHSDHNELTSTVERRNL